jgi:hypothetical protein
MYQAMQAPAGDVVDYEICWIPATGFMFCLFPGFDRDEARLDAERGAPQANLGLDCGRMTCVKLQLLCGVTRSAELN